MGQKTKKTHKEHNPNTRHTSWSRFKKSNKEGGKASIKRPKSSWSDSHRHEESDPGSQMLQLDIPGS